MQVVIGNAYYIQSNLGGEFVAKILHEDRKYYEIEVITYHKPNDTVNKPGAQYTVDKKRVLRPFQLPNKEMANILERFDD